MEEVSHLPLLPQDIAPDLLPQALQQRRPAGERREQPRQILKQCLAVFLRAEEPLPSPLLVLLRPLQEGVRLQGSGLLGEGGEEEPEEIGGGIGKPEQLVLLLVNRCDRIGATAQLLLELLRVAHLHH